MLVFGLERMKERETERQRVTERQRDIQTMRLRNREMKIKKDRETQGEKNTLQE